MSARHTPPPLCGPSCKYRGLYEGTQTSLSDMASKQADALGRVGRLRSGMISSLKRSFGRQFSEAERQAGRRLSELDDEILLAYLGSFLSLAALPPEDAGADDLRVALVEAGMNVPSGSDLSEWAQAVRAHTARAATVKRAEAAAQAVRDHETHPARPSTQAPAPEREVDDHVHELDDLFADEGTGADEGAPVPAQARPRESGQGSTTSGRRSKRGRRGRRSEETEQLALTPTPTVDDLADLFRPTDEAPPVPEVPAGRAESAPAPEVPADRAESAPAPDEQDDASSIWEDSPWEDSTWETEAAPSGTGAETDDDVWESEETSVSVAAPGSGAQAALGLDDDLAALFEEESAPSAPARRALRRPETAAPETQSPGEDEPLVLVAPKRSLRAARGAVSATPEPPADNLERDLPPVVVTAPARRGARRTLPQPEVEQAPTAPEPTPAAEASEPTPEPVAPEPEPAPEPVAPEPEQTPEPVAPEPEQTPEPARTVVQVSAPLRPELFPTTTPKTRARRTGGKVVRASATPPDARIFDVPPEVSAGESAELTDELRGALLAAVCIPRPVFTSDLVSVAGSSEMVAAWETECRAAPDAPVKFIPPKARHRLKGALVLPSEGDLRTIATEFKRSAWGECMKRYRGAKLYELGVLLHRLGDELVGHRLGDSTVLLRLSQPRGLVGVVVVIDTALEEGGSARAAMAADVEELLSERLTLVAVLTTNAETLEPIITGLTEERSRRRWDPPMPVVAAKSWEYATDRGASSTLVMGS